MTTCCYLKSIDNNFRNATLSLNESFETRFFSLATVVVKIFVNITRIHLYSTFLGSFPNPAGKLIRLNSILKSAQNPHFFPTLSISNKCLNLIQIRIIIPLIQNLIVILRGSTVSSIYQVETHLTKSLGRLYRSTRRNEYPSANTES